MTRYSQWPQKEMLVTSLLLDAANPRLVPTKEPRTQIALLQELVENDAVYELAKEIAETGYIPLENIVVVKEKNRYVVLEGNRRLASMKALLSPEIVPETYKARFRKLAKNVEIKDITSVRVLVAPSRREAAPLLMQKHTRNSIRSWQPLMQARFYRGLITDGLDISQVIAQYGAEVTKFLRTDGIYEMACRLDFPEEVGAKVRDPRKFPATNLIRLLDMPRVREYLGIEFDEGGSMRGVGDPESFAHIFTIIVTQLVDGTIDSRGINTVDEAMALLEKLERVPTDVVRPFSATDVAPSGSKNENPKHQTTRQTKGARKPKLVVPSPTDSADENKKKTPSPSPSLIPQDVVCSINNARIIEIFNELRKLPVARFPNACAVLFRMLLELSVGHYLQNTDALRDFISAQQVKNKRKPSWFPSLSQLLTILKDATPPLIAHPLARRQLEKLLSAQDQFFTVDGLDSYVHNPFSLPTERELRSYWSVLSDIFAIILVEPEGE